jgi:hypothetical protein
MADLDRISQATQSVSLFDETTGLSANIELIDGQNSIRTFGIQAIESLRGFDPQADVWFYIGTELNSTGAGAAGDTIRVQIAAGDNPAVYPSIDVTYTLVMDDAGDEEQLALNLANFLNNSSPFNLLWRAQRIQGNGVVYITARKSGGQYERPNVNDFIVSSTGTTVVTRAYDSIIRRNKITGLARDPIDPRQGQLGIQGSVVQSEGDVTTRFQTVFPTLNVNASLATPSVFTISADTTEVRFVTSVVLSGRDNGIQFGRFLAENSTLVNGIQVSFKSNDSEVFRAPIRTTDDLLDLHAEDPDNFVLFFASGADKFTAVLEFGVPLEIRPQGEFLIDDYLSISIRDNLTGVLQLRAIVSGFNREF